MGFEFIINTDIRHRFGASGIRFLQIQTKYSSRALRVYELLKMLMWLNSLRG